MMALIDRLSDRCDQSVIVRRGGLLHRRLEDGAGEAVEVIPVASSVPAAVRAARRMRLLHVHEGRSVQVGAWSSLSGTRFVVTRRVPYAPKQDPFTRWFYSRASTTVGVSEAVSSVMREYLRGPAVETILDYAPHIPVNVDNVAALKSKYAGKVVVGHVGELDDTHKGQMVILKAARRALHDHPKLHFLMVGSGCDSEMMRDYARDLPNVEFVGWTNRVGDYYSAMDVFVFPSRLEALGSAILEAMSFGLPVVAARTGGIPEVVRPGVNGELFASGDVAACLCHVIEIAGDDALRERLSVGARATAASRSLDAGVAQYMAVYEQVAGASRPASRRIGAEAAATGRRHGPD